MGHSIKRWLIAASAAAAVGGLALSLGPAASAATRFGSTAQARSAAGTYVPPAHNLYYGDRGPAVLSVQRRLNYLHYYAGPADGVYGANLEEAVWAFKEVQGLPMRHGNSVITKAFRSALVHPRAPYSRYPHGGGGRIEINQSIQVLVLYRHNVPNLIVHVSTGGRYYYCSNGGCGYAITPDGKYTALSYLPGTITVPLGFMENPVFFIGRAYAIHGGDPVPWYPASHGCVRLFSDVVNWFHTRVHIGSTHILIYGQAPQHIY